MHRAPFAARFRHRQTWRLQSPTTERKFDEPGRSLDVGIQLATHLFAEVEAGHLVNDADALVGAVSADAAEPVLSEPGAVLLS